MGKLFTFWCCGCYVVIPYIMDEYLPFAEMKVLTDEKRIPLIQCQNTPIFQLFGLRLTHFISKHSFEKRWDLLIRGKLPSLLLKSINFKWYTKYDLTTLTSYTIKYFFFLGHCQIIQTAQWTLSFHHIKILNQQQLKILCLYFF